MLLFYRFYLNQSTIMLILWAYEKTEAQWYCSLQGHMEPGFKSLCNSKVYALNQCMILSFFKYFYLCIFFFFMAVLGLYCFTRAFSSCSEQGLLFSCGVWTSHCGGHCTGLLQSPGSRCIASSCSSQALVAAAKSLQSCPTLCDPIDGSPVGSTIPGIL